jgi:hypothetical protein
MNRRTMSATAVVACISTLAVSSVLAFSWATGYFYQVEFERDGRWKQVPGSALIPLVQAIRRSTPS